MEILNLGGANENENSPAPKSRKKFKLVLGVSVVATMLGLGSTLAANISLNSGGPVEFGQGVAQTVACQTGPSGDRPITVTPISAFQNTSDGGSFVLSQIQLSGLDVTEAGLNESSSEATAHPGTYKDGSGNFVNTCDGKWFILKAYTDDADVANANGAKNLGTSGTYYRTTDGSTATPIAMHYYSNSIAGDFATRTEADNQRCSVNSGFALQPHSNGSVTVRALYADCGGYSNLVAVTSVSLNNQSSVSSPNDHFTLQLINPDADNYHKFIPVDSAWVSKITIESANEAPSGSMTGADYF